MTGRNITNEDVSVPNFQLLGIIESYHLGRCYACGWPLAPDKGNGCIPGDCSYRPHESNATYHGWHVRMEILSRVAEMNRKRNGG